MKRERAKFRIIPSSIIKAWSKDGERVSVVGRKETQNVKIEDVFTEDVNLDMDRAKFEDYTVPPLRDIETFFEKGLNEISPAFNTILSEMIGYALSASLCGLLRIRRRQSQSVGDIEITPLLRNIGKRWATEVVQDIAEAAIDAAYLFDLKGALLEAPEDSELFLGESPVFMLNPLGFVNEFPLYAQGAVFIMPYAPHKAFCLYDSKAMKFKKTDGRIMLSEDDVEKINSCIVNSGRCFVTTDPEKYSPAYCAHTQDDIWVRDVETELSPVRILAQSVDFKSEEYRPFVYALHEYDESHTDDESPAGMLEDRVAFILDYLERKGV